MLNEEDRVMFVNSSLREAATVGKCDVYQGNADKHNVQSEVIADESKLSKSQM